MTTLAYSELHAFPDGDRPHSGNPAGVCPMDAFLDDADLLGIAQSNNLSETAYLTAGAEKDVWTLRWFTPGCEVDLCGHATLAAGAYLFEDARVAGDVARFDTRSGRLEVRREEAGRYAVNFPAVPARPGDAAPGVAEAIGVAPAEVFEIDPIHGARYQMFVYGDEAEIAGLTPDFSALKRTGVNVLATARARARTWSRASSVRTPASMKTRSPARPIARLRRSGPGAWAAPSCPPARSARAPALWSCAPRRRTASRFWARRSAISTA